MKRSIEYRFEQKIRHGELKRIEMGEEILYCKDNYRERNERNAKRINRKQVFEDTE